MGKQTEMFSYLPINMQLVSRGLEFQSRPFSFQLSNSSLPTPGKWKEGWGIQQPLDTLEEPVVPRQSMLASHPFPRQLACQDSKGHQSACWAVLHPAKDLHTHTCPTPVSTCPPLYIWGPSVTDPEVLGNPSAWGPRVSLHLPS